ncbi:MAG: ferritin family protein [candidate division KSB1 bacterium]|nr:ferritin family protein [candidate division KSB1 bacterium]MDZ7357918.1 ferritin family protein [candidate division KSB1 bacterium]MDZ7401614.1 ferritin family protein [candidate division KSB1 bacterium]
MSLTVEQALKVAIDAEIQAYNLYTSAAQKISGAGTKTMLTELAQQELGHRRKLEHVLAKKDYSVLGKSVPKESRGIAEFLADTEELPANATTQQVMIFAIKKEERAFNFYTTLKDQFLGTELENLFSGLAAEEQGHKVKLEEDYEEHFMQWN